MHHFLTLALATAALAAPEADPTLVRAYHAGSGIGHPISSINNVPVIDTRSPYAAGIHAFSPYAAYAGLPATYATGLPTTYATGLPTTYATDYPYVHSYGKREAEAEADPQMIYSGLPYTGLHTAYTGLPTTYATGYPVVQTVPAVNAVHAVAPAVSSVYSHIPVTYSTIPTTYSPSPLIKALYKLAVVAPTHTLTSYNSPTQYSAVSNGSGIGHPISSINNVPVIDTRSPYTAGIHAFSPYAVSTCHPLSFLGLSMTGPVICDLPLDWVNYYRGQHAAYPVTKDDGLVYNAYLAAKGNCDHLGALQLSHNIPGVPEAGRGNLYRTSASGTAEAHMVDAVKSWYSEAAVYCKNNFYNNPPNGIGEASQQYGHFTQVVWKAASKVGIWAHSCTKSGDWVVALHMDAGNLQGSFGKNVGYGNC